MFSVNTETVVCVATIDTMPNETSRPNTARISGTPAATSEPNASTRMSSVMGNAIVSACVRSCVVVSENAL